MVFAPNFAAEALEATSAVDWVFAETFTLQPFAPSMDRTEAPWPDTSRAKASFQAVFFDAPAAPGERHAYDGRESLRPGVKTGEPSIEISPFEFWTQTNVVGVPLDIRVGDQVMREAAGVAYRVTAAFTTANGTLKLSLNRLQGAGC